MTIILGIDPGSRVTGYGLLRVTGNRHQHVASGCIRTGSGALPARLERIHAGLTAVIAEHAPTQCAIEKVFVHRSNESALKLGHARGVALLTAVLAELDVAEYGATTIKQAVVGTGRADKEQVAHMVKALLGLRDKLEPDAADALAIAICHAHSSVSPLLAAGARRSRGRSRRLRVLPES